MLKSSLCDYSDVYILVNWTITVTNIVVADVDANNTNKKVTFKNCAPFTDCINEINNTQVDNVKDLDIMMSMYNVIEYIDNYAKTSGILHQYCRDQPDLDNNGNIVNFTDNSVFVSFNPIRDGLLRAAHDRGGIWGAKRSPFLKFVTHILQWWNLAQLYLT